MMETAVMKPLHSIYLEKSSEIYHLQSLNEELFINSRMLGAGIQRGLKQETSLSGAYIQI